MKLLTKNFLVLYFSLVSGAYISAQDANVRISWDYNTTFEQRSVMVANKGYTEKEFFYPRIKKLKDGSLLMVFMNNVVGFDIFTRKSYDNGITWSDATMVRQRYSAPSTATQQDKIIFSTPDFIELSDGQILLAYQWRYQKGYNDLVHTNQNCGIEIMTSTDHGKTFSAPKSVYIGRCWEPSFLELPSGELHMYITDSNEVANNLSQPCVTLLRSFDKGKTWQQKDVATYKDGEILSRTFDARGSYDGMPSAVYLKNNNGMAMALEVWSSKYQVDETPVIVYSSNENNWRYKDVTREKGGPGPDRKKQLHKNFRGFGPYMEILPTGEVLVQSNGMYKGQQGMWVFIGDEKADNFSYASSPYTGHWGSIAYIGNNEVISSGTYTYTEEGENHTGIRSLKGKLNYAKKISGDAPELKSLELFDGTNSNDWFIGQAAASSAYLNFGYTPNDFQFTGYLFDKNLIAFTPENSDAVDFLLNRRNSATGKSQTYQLAINAKGVVTVKKEVSNSMVAVDVTGLKDIIFNIEGTVNNETDEDMGFAAKVAIPWKLIGGVPTDKDEFRVHLRHRYKDLMKEAPVAQLESMAGEDCDTPETWLRISFD